MSESKEKNEGDLNEILLHGLAPFGGSISASPYPIRVEIFLRWAKIPYSKTNADPMHPYTKKTPWMEYKGKDYPDSVQIIEMLSKDFNVDPDEHLSVEERAVSRAFARMLGEATTFAGFAWRFQYSDNGKIMLNHLFNNSLKGKIIGHAASYKFKQTLWAQGTSRLPQEVVLNEAYKDFKACADLVGDKPYAFGNKISSLDFFLFGIFAILKFCMNNSAGENKLDHFKEFPKLEEYFERLKAEYFPDWNTINEDNEALRHYKP